MKTYTTEELEEIIQKSQKYQREAELLLVKKSYDEGFDGGYHKGFDEGYNKGYDEGYEKGLKDASRGCR
jgi:flagellar biosynthesis/type III secretory pathway protein FliH